MFKGEVDGVEVSVWFGTNKTEFSSEFLEKRYDSFPAVEKAIKAKLLSLRKDFTDKQAAYVPRWDNDKATTVEVTSLDGEEYAWITKPNGRREKVRREALFADLGQVLAAQIHEAQRKKETEAEWDAVPRWEPKKEQP